MCNAFAIIGAAAQRKTLRFSRITAEKYSLIEVPI
jgi:hypothetical protein